MFVQKLQHHFFDDKIIRRCLDWNFPIACGAKTAGKSIRLVLPYCPVLSIMLKGLLASFNEQAHGLWDRHDRSQISISLSCSAGGPSLLQRLVRISNRR